MDLLSIDDLTDAQIATILDEGERWFAFNRQPRRNDRRLDGLTVLNAFFENSTRTLLSFEIAAKRLGAQMVTMQVDHSSIKKGETLEDTARPLKGRRPERGCRDHGLSGDQRRRRHRRASDPGAARRRHLAPPLRADRGTEGRH